MSQQTPNENPILPILLFLGIVGVVMFALLPRTPQRSTTADPTDSAPTSAPTDTVAVVPTTAPTEAAIVPTTAPTVTPEETSAEATPVVVAFDPAAAYAWACSGCHGADGRGVEGFGPSLAFSSAVVGRDVNSLVAMFNVAQPPTDPAAGFVHPYRGGYPELNDEELSQLMDYLFTIVAG